MCASDHHIQHKTQQRCREQAVNGKAVWRAICRDYLEQQLVIINNNKQLSLGRSRQKTREVDGVRL